jgi:hypothetical protein
MLLMLARCVAMPQVYILSMMHRHNRELELDAVGLALDGGPGKQRGEEAEVGLHNCTLTHVYGYTTDEKAIRRLPLHRADAAVVVADASEDDHEAHGGSELQIADSEALTSTILLRRLRSEIERSTPTVPPLTIVTEFVDLLTRRLLERQKDLIESAPRLRSGGMPAEGVRGRISLAPTTSLATPTKTGGESSRPAGGTQNGSAPPANPVQSVVFHRNYIETTALSLAAHSNTSWVTVQMLLDPFSGFAIQSILIEATVPMPPIADEITDVHTLSLDDAGESVGEVAFSFAFLSDCIAAHGEGGLGLLIGWRRQGGEVEINPADKAKFLPWRRGDELIVLRRT